MSMEMPSILQALHKEASISEEPTVSQATCVAQHCHPGKINFLQLEKTIGSHPCWQTAVHTCAWNNFPSAGACSPVRKDGYVSRGTGKEKLNAASPMITKLHTKENKLC